MKATYTAGPWTVSASTPDGYALSIHGAQLETGGFPVVADIPERTIHGTHEANARLISSAPDLLEVLQVIAADSRWTSGEPLLMQVRAAINKATGA